MKGKNKGWKGESRRHSLARKGVSTARGNCQFKSDKVSWYSYMHQLSKQFRGEIGLVKKVATPFKSKEDLFEEILKKARTDTNVSDEEMVRLEDLADKLYLDYQDEQNKYFTGSEMKKFGASGSAIYGQEVLDHRRYLKKLQRKGRLTPRQEEELDWLDRVVKRRL